MNIKQHDKLINLENVAKIINKQYLSTCFSTSSTYQKYISLPKPSSSSILPSHSRITFKSRPQPSPSSLPFLSHLSKQQYIPSPPSSPPRTDLYQMIDAILSRRQVPVEPPEEPVPLPPTPLSLQTPQALPPPPPPKEPDEQIENNMRLQITTKIFKRKPKFINENYKSPNVIKAKKELGKVKSKFLNKVIDETKTQGEIKDEPKRIDKMDVKNEIQKLKLRRELNEFSNRTRSRQNNTLINNYMTQKKATKKMLNSSSNSVINKKLKKHETGSMSNSSFLPPIRKNSGL